MAYVTISDLSQRLGTALYARLTDRVNGMTADNTVAQCIVDEAEAEANSYLARRYAVPLDVGDYPELARLIGQRVLDIAEYLAWRSSPFVSDLPGRVEALYAEARQWFLRVAAGEIELPAARPLPDPTGHDDGPRYRSSARRFTADELDGL